MNGFILCVEDNLKVQRFNKPLLEKKGFTVKLAMTLAEAREELLRETPDCIILDIHLPDGNGLDFLRELRESSSIPVIALTNNKKEADIVAGFASGCDDYLTKPYTFPVLYARIEAIMPAGVAAAGEDREGPARPQRAGGAGVCGRRKPDAQAEGVFAAFVFGAARGQADQRGAAL